MKENLKAEIFSIGTELLLGEILDTNSVYLSNKLKDLGIFVYQRLTIGDNLKRLTQAIKDGLERADIIILSGGLGPTDDDVTREAICQVMGEEPTIDPELLLVLKERFNSRKRPMPENNLKQAWLIPSATAITNPVGTAPGWFVKKNKKIIIAMPGPPHEMSLMWEEQVAPQLPKPKTKLYHKTIHTVGLGESHLCQLISEFTQLENPGIGTYARKNGVDIRVGSTAKTIKEARAIASPVIEKITERLLPHIYGYDDETLESALIKLFRKKGYSFAVVEDGTDGVLAQQFSCLEQKSGYKGAMLCESARALEVVLGCKGGGAMQASERAAALARGGMALFKSDLCLATAQCAEGFWVAVGEGSEVCVEIMDWRGTPDMMKRRAVRTVLQLCLERLRS